MKNTQFKERTLVLYKGMAVYKVVDKSGHTYLKNVSYEMGKRFSLSAQHWGHETILILDLEERKCVKKYRGKDFF